MLDPAIGIDPSQGMDEWDQVVRGSHDTEPTAWVEVMKTYPLGQWVVKMTHAPTLSMLDQLDDPSEGALVNRLNSQSKKIPIKAMPLWIRIMMVKVNLARKWNICN